MPISTVSPSITTTIMPARYTDGEWLCTSAQKNGDRACDRAPAQASLYQGPIGRRHAAGICVCRPPSRDAVGMGRGSGDEAPNPVRNGSTFHLGDATVTGMTGRKKKFWPECCFRCLSLLTAPMFILASLLLWL
jgi:hypothetical protein